MWDKNGIGSGEEFFIGGQCAETEKSIIEILQPLTKTGPCTFLLNSFRLNQSASIAGVVYKPHIVKLV